MNLSVSHRGSYPRFVSQQQGQLCAQHCLNALLQDARFTAVDLAELAHSLDAQERDAMLEGGVQSDDLRRFLDEPSGNLDDSGYFSIQVIRLILKFFIVSVEFCLHHTIGEDRVAFC